MADKRDKLLAHGPYTRSVSHEWSPTQVDRGNWAILLFVATLGFVLHLATAGNYGIFRDELYYLDCARHLGWGYVDQPPLSIAILKFSVAVFGDSVWSIRLLPALAGVTLVIFTGLMALRFGGGRFSVIIASLAALVVPVYLINTGFYSMNALDLILWAGLLLVLAQILATQNSRLWLFFGTLFGLALLNKIGVIALAAGLLPALLITNNAHFLKKKRFWWGVLAAAILFMPHVLWQITNGWPTAEFVRNATETKIVALSFFEFFAAQIPMMNPILLPVWLIGLAALLFWRRLRNYRALGILWIACFLFFGLQRSKAYYLSPAYPPLMAAGAVMIEHWLRGRVRWVRGPVIAVVFAGGVLIAPIALPMLPPAELLAYMEQIGISPKAEETSAQAELPQYLADRFGWENMAQTVADAYHALPDSLRRRCTIIARNYGEAGALNYYRSKYSLPRTISQHNSYYLWGTEGASGEVLLAINYSDDDLRRVYDSVIAVALIKSEWAMPFEARVYVHLCTGLKVPWEEVWQSGKLYH